MAYAFGDLLKDIGSWLLLGVAVAALISALVPEDFLGRYLNDSGLSLFLMLLVGIPLYICATASTPIAAALVLKGLSPGTALVFLLAGPATNAATIAIVHRYWGRASTIIYLLAIGSCSLLLGWLVNHMYAWSNLDITRWVHSSAQDQTGLWSMFAALLLLALIVRPYLHRKQPADSGSCG